MNIAVCTIQRDRARWLREWVVFHSLVGVSKFYIYLHRCADDSERVVRELQKDFDVEAFEISDDSPKPQLATYQHCYQTYNAKHDWLAFIDGDEFLFSPQSLKIQDQLEKFGEHTLGAVAVYWACFGSSGHNSEPEGLVTDNYRYRAEQGNLALNSHIKSIVRGGLDGFSVLHNAHYFQTPGGTFDTDLRPIEHGLTQNFPCWDSLRINHYCTQSRSFYESFKRSSGAADFDPKMIRGEDWWVTHDRNEVLDDSLDHIRPRLHAAMEK